MNPFMFLYAFVLFFVLTPGVLITLPPKSKKLIVAATHGVVFALIWTLTHKLVWKSTRSIFEGVEDRKDEHEEKHEEKREEKYVKRIRSAPAPGPAEESAF